MTFLRGRGWRGEKMKPRKGKWFRVVFNQQGECFCGPSLDISFDKFKERFMPKMKHPGSHDIVEMRIEARIWEQPR